MFATTFTGIYRKNPVAIVRKSRLSMNQEDSNRSRALDLPL